MPGRRRHPLVLLSAFFVALAASTVLAGCCCLRRSRPRPKPCLTKIGCPAPTPLPKCGARVTAMARPLSDVLGTPEARRGRTVTVRSRLRRGGGSCTELLCRPGTCCNGCGALFMLSTAARPDQSHPHTLTLLNRGPGPHPHPKLACSGDDSLLCCPFAPGQDVVVTGRLMQLGVSIHGKTWVLQNPRLCAP